MMYIEGDFTGTENMVRDVLAASRAENSAKYVPR